MLKIFLTGDNHIGLRYASHERPELLAKARITAFEGMVEAANEEKCDLFVVAGDLFENASVAKQSVKDTLDILAGFEGTVVVLPGNHDYYDCNHVSSLWQSFEKVAATKDNIMLLKDFRPYTLPVNEETVVLYPALCASLHSAPGENNLGWIREEHIIPDDVYRIGVAHGAVEGETIDREGEYFLMRRDELEQIPVDAWLIGHTHVPFPQGLQENRYTEMGRIFNAGTHVQTDVACGTEGCCFVIEVDSGNGPKKVRAKKVRTGNLHFYRKNISLTAGKMDAILKRELDALPDNSVVDLILSGAVTDEEYKNRHAILHEALSRFIEGTYSDAGLSRVITKELVEAEFPETSFSAKLLLSLMDEPKEAQLTYELLKSLKGAH
jgi:DNA repair exonuclease SbcCD nuclease subunit